MDDKVKHLWEEVEDKDLLDMMNIYRNMPNFGKDVDDLESLKEHIEKLDLAENEHQKMIVLTRLNGIIDELKQKPSYELKKLIKASAESIDKKIDYNEILCHEFDRELLDVLTEKVFKTGVKEEEANRAIREFFEGRSKFKDIRDIMEIRATKILTIDERIMMDDLIFEMGAVAYLAIMQSDNIDYLEKITIGFNVPKTKFLPEAMDGLFKPIMRNVTDDGALENFFMMIEIKKEKIGWKKIYDGLMALGVGEGKEPQKNMIAAAIAKRL